MLMEPLIRRHDHAARPPIDALRRFTRGPENRIALTGKNDDMRAGAVLVPFLVRAHGELGDMRAHGVFGQVEFHVRAALAALAVIGELERVRVGHKVRRQEKPPGQFSLAAEVAFGARIEAVEKA